jgi:WD40 repeat protein
MTSSASDDGVVSFAQISAVSVGHEQPITALCVTATNTLWSAGSDRRLRAVDVSAQQDQSAAVRVFVAPTAVSFLLPVDGQCCYAVDAGLYALDVAAGHSRALACVRGDAAAVPLCGVTDAAHAVLWLGYADRVVRAFVDGQCCAELRAGHRDAVRALALAGEHLFSAGDDGYVLRWRVHDAARTRPSGQFDFVHQGLRGPVRALVTNAASAATTVANHRVFWAEQDVVVALRLASFQRLDLSAHPNATVLSLAFEHGFLFSGASDRTIVVWDVDASAPVVRLTGAGGPINAIALLGNVVAAASTTLQDPRPAVLQWSLQAAIASTKSISNRIVAAAVTTTTALPLLLPLLI